jgi:hypothetical protein
VIGGYRVPNSLAATTMPYRLAPASCSMVGIFVDCGVAGAVAALVAAFELVVAHELQPELKRVGCDGGNIDGDWNAASRRALEIFNKRAVTKLDIRVANFNALSLIRSRTLGICPLSCGRGSRVRGDRCANHQVAGGPRNAFII